MLYDREHQEKPEIIPDPHGGSGSEQGNRYEYWAEAQMNSYCIVPSAQFSATSEVCCSVMPGCYPITELPWPRAAYQDRLMTQIIIRNRPSLEHVTAMSRCTAIKARLGKKKSGSRSSITYALRYEFRKFYEI